jgi:hypothetical protein
MDKTKGSTIDAEFDHGARLRRGGCRCGAVRFALRGEPTIVGTCHCTNCRRETGSAFLFYADWPRTAFSSTGQVATFQGRSFCPTCGSRLFHLSDHVVEVMLGSLDDAPSDLNPSVECWVKRREHWLAPVSNTEQFHQGPS